MSRETWQLLAAVIVLGLGGAGARAQSSGVEAALTPSAGVKPTEIAVSNATCPQGTIDRMGYCADDAQSKTRVEAHPPLLRSPAQQIQNVIQDIQSLQHKCGPTQVWSAREKGCIESD